MENQKFDEIVRNRIKQTQKLITGKAKEYARGDRLSNFKWVAEMDNITPEKALWGMWSKHICSIKYILDDLDKGIIPSDKIINEKCGDMVVYAILLEALLKERLNN